MKGPEVHVISHTHWDREWYLTFEQYRARLVDLVDGVLDRMAAEPRFTSFHLDGQTVVLQDYLEVRPEREKELRARVGQGRLLIGPWYVMPDMFLVSGEALVRNLALGIRIATAFGGAMRVGYMPDPFGHVAQMPQILTGFGLEGAILWRGFGGRKAEYLWEAPDGSRVLLLHLPPEGYCNGLRLPLLAPEPMRRQAVAIVARELDRSSSNTALLMVGVDHVEPHPALLEVVDALAEPDAADACVARMSTLPAYVAAVTTALADRIEELDVIRGELRGGEDYAHLLPGVLSARTYLKQANVRVQREIERWAEPVSVFAMLSGVPVAPGMLRYAWLTLLQNHPHDSICGCSIDEVHEENVTRFERALQAAEAVTQQAVRNLGARIPPAPPGAIRCLLLNTDSTEWSGVVEGTIEVPLEPVESGRELDQSALETPLVFFDAPPDVSAVTDHQNRPLPFQVTRGEDTVSYRMSRYAPPVPIRVRRLHLVITADAIPPLSYSAVDVHVSKGPGSGAAPRARAWLDGEALENDLVRVEVRADGTVDVVDKRRKARYQRVFTFECVGDVGDEYNYSAPANDIRVTNAQAENVRVRAVEGGPLVVALSIEMTLPVPAAASPDRRSRLADVVQLPVALEVRLRAGAEIVECVARIDNRTRDHRLRVLCPTGATAVKSHRADTAFDIVERPAIRPPVDGPLMEAPVATAPLQSFVDAGDDSTGAVMVADGLMEYELVSDDAGGAIALTLLRSVGDLSRNDLAARKGHAGPGLPAPGAQCQGVHEFRFAFVPRGAAPAPGDLFRVARRFLTPPRLFSPCGGGDGTLPVAQSYIGIDAEPDASIVLSACKVADERSSVVLRMFNPTFGPAVVKISSPVRLSAAYLTDLTEHRQQRRARAGGSLGVRLGPHRIQTIELVPPRG
jgi:2-O-(6-phospho-alpha-D-mannosyl)-D-glycerate hydrolase